MKIILSLFLALSATDINLLAAEAGMPQLDPKYWASQAFWLILVFTILYLLISKFFLPKVKINLNNRSDKIKDDLDQAKNLKKLADEKQNEYETIIEDAKREVIKILAESKNQLDQDIQKKKVIIDKEIENELEKIQLEIAQLKKNSIQDIAMISEEMTSKIIEDIAGDKLNESSIKAAVSEISKNNMSKYL
jgi:F-type H+-transporting ATPase subunit b